MTLNIRPGNLSDEVEFEEFQNIISSRVDQEVDFKVNMEETGEMDLSRFNTLIKLYMNFRRSGRNLEFSNLQEAVIRYVDKTNFHHVFTH